MFVFRADDVDWIAIGKRLQGYRLVKGLTVEELADRCELKTSTLSRIEEGHKYRAVNCLWSIIRSEGVSINWFINGIGEYHTPDPPDMLPTTIVRDRGAGIRRPQFRVDAEEGQFSDDPLEFIMAVDAYRRLNSKPFPTLTELFEIVIELGYRKVEAPSISPRSLK